MEKKDATYSDLEKLALKLRTYEDALKLFSAHRNQKDLPCGFVLFDSGFMTRYSYSQYSSKIHTEFESHMDEVIESYRIFLNRQTH